MIPFSPRSLSPLCGLVLLLAAPLAAQEKVTLRYALKPDSVTWVEQTSDMTQVMTPPGGKEMKTAIVTSMWLETKVKEVKDGVATIEQRYARVKAKSDSPMMKVDYDSDVEGSKAGPLRNLAELVGKTATLKVDARGKVHEATMPDGGEEALAAVGSSLKQGFEQAVAAWPEQPVGVGDTWQTDMAMPMQAMGELKIKITNKVVAIAAGKVDLDVKMDVDASDVKMPGGMAMTVTKAEGKSKTAFDSMMPIESTQTMVMEMGGGQAPMKMVMTMVATMKQVPAPAPKTPAAAPAEAPKTGGGK
jgi:hypothetical protein